MQDRIKRPNQNKKPNRPVSNVEPKKSQPTPGVEIKIITAMIFLVGFGVVMSFSASEESIDSIGKYIFKMCCNLGVGIGAFILLWYVDIKRFNNKFYSMLIWIISVLLIFITRYSPWGVNSNGAYRWLKIGRLPQFQTIELIKVFVIIFLAINIYSNWKEMHLVKTFIFRIWCPVAVISLLLLFITSDLSGALIVALMTFFATWITSPNKKVHLGLFLGMVALVFIAKYYMSTHLPDADKLQNIHPYQLVRVYSWLAPEKYGSDGGYQILHSLYAIGSGGLFGRGLGESVQKISRLSEAENDMIFAIICEELGIIGAIIIFFLFGYLIYYMYKVVKESGNMYTSLIVMGVMLHFSIQVIVNVCVAVNFFPNTGVPLPFISAGGTSLILAMAETGMVVGIRSKQVSRKYSKG